MTDLTFFPSFMPSVKLTFNNQSTAKFLANCQNLAVNLHLNAEGRKSGC